MTDNLQDRGGRDRTHIDVHQDWELRYWSEKLGCTHEQLKQAVKAAGSSVTAVQQYLASNTPGSESRTS